MEELEVRTSGSSPPVAHTTVNHIKGLKVFWGELSWKKHYYEFIQIFFSFHDTSKHSVNVVL